VATLVSCCALRVLEAQTSGHHGMVNEWLTRETP
jgi:hypothetical protein